MNNQIKLLCLSVFLLSAINAFGWELDRLSPERREAINQGQTITFTEQVEDSDWPRLLYFRRVKASAEEIISVFHDYNRHREFIHNMTKSEVVPTNSDDPEITNKSHIKDVSYTIRTGSLMGISFGDERYSTRYTLSMCPSQFGRTYKIEWHQLSADSTTGMNGTIVAEDQKEGDAILHHQTSTVLKRWGASLPPVVSHYINRGKRALDDFVNRVQKMKVEGSLLLDEEIQETRAALGET